MLEPLIGPGVELDRAESRRVLRSATRLAWLDARLWVPYTSGLLAFVFLLFFAVPPLFSAFGPVVLLLVALVPAGLALVTMYILRRDVLVRYVRLELNRRGCHVCVRCGYALAKLGDGTPTCPECGSSLESRYGGTNHVPS